MKNFIKYFFLCITAFCICSLQVYSQTSPETFENLSDRCFALLETGDQNSFDEEYPKLYRLYARQIDPDYDDPVGPGQDSLLVETLFGMRDRDQSIRLLLMKSYKKYGENSEMSRRIRVEMNAVDESNAVEVQNIIDKYGWLGQDKVGESGNQTLFLCIQHVDDVLVQDKYLSVLRDAVRKGNAEPWHFAFLTDRTLMNKGERQVYGTQKIISHADPSKSYVVPLQDPDNVDKLRSEVGLEPLGEELEGSGLEWNLEEYKKRLPEIEKMYQSRFEKLNTKK